MRKLILSFILLFTFTWAFCQHYTMIKPELYLGTNQGVNLWPNVSFTPKVAQNFDVRYKGGFTVRYVNLKYFGFQAELNYSQQGWSETSATGERYSHRFDYLELPILAHIYFGKKNTKFFVNLGPEIRYMISDAATTPFAQGAGIQQTKEIENRFDYGITGGLGIEFRTQKIGAFQLEARYHFGLNNVFNASKKDDFSKSSNQAISVGIVYLFNVLK